MKLTLYGLILAAFFGAKTSLVAQGILPQVTLIASAKNVAAGSDIFLKAIATDEEGHILKAEFYLNGFKLGEDNSYPYVWEVKNVKSGRADFSVKVTDDNGNTASSSATVEAAALRMPDYPEATQAGLQYKYYEISSGQTYPAPGDVPSDTGVTGAFDLSVKKRDAFYSISYSGYINVPEEGLYSFYLSADDEARFFIGDELVAEKGNLLTEGKKTGLKAGKHRIKMDYLQNDGSNWLSLEIAGPGITRRAVSPHDLFNTGTVRLPYLYLRGPSSGSSFQAPAYQIYFETSDISGVSKVEFLAGNTVVGTDSTFPYDYSWEQVPQGYYYISARGYTSKGAVTYSNVNAVKSRPEINTPPSVNLLPLPHQLYVSSEIIRFEVQASDAEGLIRHVTYYVDGQMIGDIFTGDFSVNWSATEGTHQVKAVAFDDNGDSTVSQPLTVTVQGRGNIHPEVYIVSPPYGRAYFYPETISFEIDARDRDGAVSYVEYYVNGNLARTQNASSSFNWSWVNPAVSGYNIYVRAYDNQGSYSQSEDIWIYVNPKPNPTASIVSPAAGTVFHSPASILIDAETAELDGGVSLVEFYANGRFIGQTTDPSSDFTWNNVPEGVYDLKAYAYDSKGVVTYTQMVTVQVRTAHVSHISSPSCADKNQNIQLELDPALRSNVVNYRWWTNTSNAKVSGTPVWNLNTGSGFAGGQFCVDVDYSGGGYKQFCRQIALCSSRRVETAYTSTDLEAAAVVLAPNPSADVFSVTSKKEVLSLIVTDQLGRSVYAASDLAAGEAMVFGSDFKAGIYQIHVTYPDGAVEIVKAVKK